MLSVWLGRVSNKIMLINTGHVI
ncbi:hypothetical protein DESHY_70029 [Desulforamulus hydrothermalis Lam5 = DSM 18033]|uniref:Uncharacterized protein n=1 Tax=Desulforamulus hydrothermalis Lam5 = DSM 18033 TaxID=1121428 RepID=K8EC17_9FIRM|nr:hypothetical protein DESHY_70029 [Desulforamulus hydrothermalis Lam5 = DSM 18033]